MGATVVKVAWYIASVWMGPTEYELGKPQVIRLQASTADDYRARIRELWPTAAVLAIGPVSLSKRQG
jgi:hypothetical protein